MAVSQNGVLLFDQSSGAGEVNDDGASVILSGATVPLFRFAPAGFVLNNSAVLGVQRSTDSAVADKGRVFVWDTATGVQSLAGTAYTTSTVGSDAPVVAKNSSTGNVFVIPVSGSRAALAGTTSLLYDPVLNTAAAVPSVVQPGAKFAAFSNDGSKLAVVYEAYSGGTLPGSAVRIYDTATWMEISIPAASTWHATLSAVTQCSTVAWSPDDSHLGFGFGPHLRVYIVPYGDWSNPVLAASRGVADNYHFVWTPNGNHVAELYFSGGASNVVVRSFPGLVTERSFDAGASDRQLGFLPDNDTLVIGRDFNALYAGGVAFMSTILSGITLRAYTPGNALVFMAGPPVTPPVTTAFWTNRIRTQEVI